MAQIKTPYGLVYNTDGTLCTTYRDDVVPFRGVRSFAVETATTNLIQNPQFLEGMTGYGSYNYGGGGYIEAVNGIAHMHNENGTKNLALVKNIQGLNTTLSYTLSAKVRSANNKNISVYAFLGAGYYSLGTAPASGEWVIVKYTYFPEQFSANPLLSFLISPFDYLQVDWIQLEQKPFATSFVDGSRPTGKLKFNITKTENMIFSGWVKMYDIGVTQYLWTRIISFEDDNDNERISFGYDRSVEKFFISIKDENNENTIRSINIYSYNTWYFFAFILDNGIYKAYIYDDNGFCETITNTKSATALSFFDVIVGYRKKTGQDLLNGVIANLYVGKYRKPNGEIIWTDDYIREVYEAQIPFPVSNKLSIY